MKLGVKELTKVLADHKAWAEELFEEKIKLDTPDERRANLCEAVLISASLQAAILLGANLENANLENATLENANLRTATLRNAILTGAYLRNAILENANLQGANLENAILTGAYLRNAILLGATLENATLENAILENANLTGAYLRNANLLGATLENANLENANLENANLENANLENANLQGANLYSTRLNGIQFRSVSLRYTDLSRAQVGGADFSRVSVDVLNQVKWGEGVFFDAETKWPTLFSQPHNLSPLSVQFVISVKQNAFWLVLGLFFSIIAGGLATKGIITRKKVGEQAAKVLNLERQEKDPPTAAASFIPFIEQQLRLVSERERLVMFSAQGRASALFFLGTALMVLSVFAPMATLYVYVTLNPLDIPVETVTLLQELKGKEFPFEKITLSAQKDWRILASGLSFGFLFLAAARGVLRQEAQQRDTYFRLGRRVTYYENLISALKIGDSWHDIEQNPHVQKYVERAIERLIEGPTEELGEQTTETPESLLSTPLTEKIGEISNVFTKKTASGS